MNVSNSAHSGEVLCELNSQRERAELTDVVLEVDFVSNQAAKYMKNHLDVSNCADVLMCADMLGDLDLVDYCGRYIASRDDLLTNSEDDVVQAALRWVELDQEVRLRHLPNLCLSFRHSFVSSKQLVDLEKKCLSTDIKLVYSDSTTRRLGQARSEMQIFVRVSTGVFPMSVPCYDPSMGELYTMNMPNNLVGYSIAVTPGDELYVAGGVVNCRKKVSDDFEGCKKLKTFYEYNHLLNTWEQSFTTTNNAWNKITNRNKPAPHPQAIVYRGSIYCACNMGPIIRTLVEIYNPEKGEWKQSGKYAFASHATILARYGETMYLLMAHRDRNHYPTDTGIGINQYHPKTDSWHHKLDIDSRQRQSVQDKSSLAVPPMVHWLCSMGLRHTLQVHCLTARMVPECLRHYGTEIYKDPAGHGEEGSGISGDSEGEEDLSDQEDDRSGSDNGNI
uniref:BACK domain-containing protein n=1 Tax=Branchiostoma floridae TaxID=7739 RepID=C3XR23_BRAFL|eukprot:XP_002613132.1 hypothetical protein BRAFLDRAFT_73036 [Branchiostoma floridae]